MNNPNIDIIASDFDLKLLNAGKACTLLGALRKGGTTTTETPMGPWQGHGVGVWHLLAVVSEKDNVQRIIQWHIPRHAMAVAWEELCSCSAEGRVELLPSSKNGFSGVALVRSGKGKALIEITGSSELHPVPPWFKAGLTRDIKKLVACRDMLSSDGGTFVLEGLTTPTGEVIRSANRILVECIAFEWETTPGMGPHQFGCYSAYCTMVDFCSGPIREEIPEEFSQIHSNHDREDADMMLVGVVYFAYDALSLAVPDGANASDVQLPPHRLQEVLDAMPRHERTLVVLMNGMHESRPLLSMATATGMVEFERCVEILCRHFQPDSPEEQELRANLAHMRYFRTLASEGGGKATRLKMVNGDAHWSFLGEMLVFRSEKKNGRSIF